MGHGVAGAAGYPVEPCGHGKRLDGVGVFTFGELAEQLHSLGAPLPVDGTGLVRVGVYLVHCVSGARGVCVAGEVGELVDFVGLVHAGADERVPDGKAFLGEGLALAHGLCAHGLAVEHGVPCPDDARGPLATGVPDAMAVAFPSECFRDLLFDGLGGGDVHGALLVGPGFSFGRLVERMRQRRQAGSVMRTSPALSCFGEPRPPWRGDACIRVRGLVPGDGSSEGVSRSLDAGQSPALLCVVCRQVGVLVASSAFP